jgi:predicted DNA-binding ribbon-helix-helix protein
VLTFEEFWLILKQMEERQKLSIKMQELVRKPQPAAVNSRNNNVSMMDDSINAS